MAHNGVVETSSKRKRLIRKHEIMLDYLEKKYGVFYRNYDYDASLSLRNPNLEGRVWSCWWQGIENAPDIVKCCVESIQRNAGKHKVTVITEKNLSQYVQFPNWVNEKKRKGIMSLTHYSDLLRMSLLAQYGGLWLDATFLCTEKIEDALFSMPLFTIKRPDYLHCSVAQGYYANYSLGCNIDNRWIFRTLRDFYLHYWSQNDYLVDYLLTDYLIALMQKHNKRIADAFAEVEPNNPRCDDLCKLLGEPYEGKKWTELSENTGLFKLTWKQSFPIEKKGKQTYYGKILQEYYP
ncbi:polysaccharide biosynthesis protein [Bifidobacterium eulemuris]|nr:polysaccharide biosynthesis protein [Bifidobacterium eulemuris]